MKPLGVATKLPANTFSFIPALSYVFDSVLPFSFFIVHTLFIQQYSLVNYFLGVVSRCCFGLLQKFAI